MTKRIGWRGLAQQLGKTLGFTLIEMAIVLVVIGLIVSGGLVAVGPVIENAKINETNQKLDRVEQALTVYTIRNTCLPCPASPSEPATGTYAAGVAVHGTTEYTANCATGACAFAQGVIPWRALGISEADASDAFGTRFSYAVTQALTLDASMERDGTSYPAGTLDVNNNANTVITDSAAYVVISHGPDRAYGFRSSVGGAAIPAAAYSSAFEADNSDGNPTYQQSDYVSDKSGTAYFDDIVRWRSAPMIIQQCGSGICGNPL